MRTILNQEQWERIAPELQGKVGDPGATASDNRLFVEAVLWFARTGAPWRDLPREFGKSYSIYTRSGAGHRKVSGRRISRPFRTIRLRIRPHRRNLGPGPSAWHRRKRGNQNQAIGKSRGGLTTKNPSTSRCLWQSGALRAPTGPASRHHQL